MKAPRSGRLRLPQLTRRGWAMLASAVVALIAAYSSSWRDLQYVAIFFGVVLVVSAVNVRGRAAAVSVHRRIYPTVVGAGESISVSVRVENRGWVRSPRDSWRDVVPAGFETPDFQPLPALAGRGEKGSVDTLRYPLVASARGIYEIGPMVVQRADPFGLTVHERRVGDAVALTVLPRITPLAGGVPGRTSNSDAAIRQLSAGRGLDDVIAREYRSGDALRHVHWRATAHRGELMVRQEQRQEESGAIVVLETRREALPSAEAFEWAVEFAASVFVHLSRAGCRVTLIETAERDGALNLADHGTELGASEALAGLATVRRQTDRRGRSRYLERIAELQGSSSFPVIAILGEVPPTEVTRLAPIRSRSGVASLVLVSDIGAQPSDELWNSGWHCTTARPGDDQSQVWSAVGAGGAARG